MVSMKTRVINGLNTFLAETTDAALDAADARQYELGASTQFIAKVRVDTNALRAAVPAAIRVVKEQTRASDSLARVLEIANAAGLDDEVIGLMFQCV